MTGRDKSVGWCEVETCTGDLYILPRAAFDDLETNLDKRRGGWASVTDVYGAEQRFLFREVRRLTSLSPEAIRIREQEEAEDRLLHGDE
jgi:hypothetical protein